MRYAIIIEETATGCCAYVPDLPGCVAAGDNFDHVIELMRGAIEMHLEGIHEDGNPIPLPTSVAHHVEVNVPAAA